jgi:hypothetical protein
MMPALRNQRQERFCQALAAGKSASLAYEEAGYVPNRGNASILKTRQNIIDRVLELQGQQRDRLVLSRQYVVDALLENAEKALGRKPVKIGADGKEVYIYRGDVANRAIQLAGIEVGLFIERKEVKHVGEFDKLSDEELVKLLAQEAQMLLLSDRSGGSEDGNERS